MDLTYRQTHNDLYFLNWTFDKAKFLDHMKILLNLHTSPNQWAAGTLMNL